MNEYINSRTRSRDDLVLRFPNLSRPVVLHDCRELEHYLPLVFGGWPIESVKDDQTPLITVKQLDNGRCEVDASWLREGADFDDPADTMCSLVAKVIRAWTLEQGDLLFLHGAGVRIGGALAVFPNRFRTGKSILTAALAARGHQVFGDDVVPIPLKEGCGIAAGIAPRLRSPYPENLEIPTRKYIESHTGLKGRRYHYLDLRESALAEFGSRAEIGAFVLLERDSGVTPHLIPVSQAEVLRCVVWQNFAREIDATSILERLSQLVSNVNCYRLVYDRVDDAADLLGASLGDHPIGTLEHFAGPSDPADLSLEKEIIPAGHFQRRPGIVEICQDGESFLADSNGASIHHLNSIGTAVWSLLEEPVSPGQIIDLLQSAFPGVDRKQIGNDIYELLNSLQQKQLIINGDEDARLQ